MSGKMALWILLLPLMLSAPGCIEPATPAGVVAMVNGQPISLRLVQALLDVNRMTDFNGPRPSVLEMRQNYAQATAMLICGLLVRQELAERGMAVDEQEWNRACGQIKSELGEDNFNNSLIDAALREEDWRLLVLDHLAGEAFMKKVIEPSITISLEEIREYYETHKPDFADSPLYRVCFAQAQERETVETWCASGKELQKGSLAHCFVLGKDSLPSPWQEEIRKIEPFSCGKIVKQDEQWRTVALIETLENDVAPLSVIYPIVENILLAERKNTVFNEWLKNKLASSRITASPGLFKSQNFDQ